MSKEVSRKSVPKLDWAKVQEEQMNRYISDYHAEGNSKFWQSSGLDCMMLRSPLGCWCAYVIVDKDHPWYERSPEDIEEDFEKELKGDEDPEIYKYVFSGFTKNYERKGKWALGWDYACRNSWIPRSSINELSGGIHYYSTSEVVEDVEAAAKILSEMISKK
jgi:hypothetical protein